MSAPNFDEFARLIDNLDTAAAQWQAQADQLTQRLSEATATVERREFSLTVSAAKVTELRFSSLAASVSPVQLREAILSAYAEAARQSNLAAAGALRDVGLPEVASGVGDAAPEQDPGDRPAPASPPAPSATAPTTGQPGHRTTARTETAGILDDPTLDDEVISGSIDEIMADVDGWRPGEPPGDPQMMQYDLEREIRTITAHADEYAETMRGITAEQESKLMTLSVGAGGRLTDIRLRAAFRAADPETMSKDFSVLYARGMAEVSRRALEALGDRHRDDDPTLAALRTDREEAEATVSEATGNDPGAR